MKYSSAEFFHYTVYWCMHAYSCTHELHTLYVWYMYIFMYLVVLELTIF